MSYEMGELNGPCMNCGSAGIRIAFVGSQPLADCSACGLLANCTEGQLRPVRASAGSQLRGVGFDVEKILDDITGAAQDAVQDALHSAENDLRWAIEHGVADALEEFGIKRKNSKESAA